ncbi:MAG TPA: tetratricopeptide repeat protein [Stenomitos sp.]
MASRAEEGRNAYRAGRFDEAARHLLQAVAEAPHDSALRLMLARSLEQDRQLEAARDHFRHVVQNASLPEHQRLAAQALAELDNPSDELTHRLIRSGTLTDAELQHAIAQRRPEETPLSAVLRTTGTRFSDLVAVRFGPQGLHPNIERPLTERIGMRLVGAKAITQFQLKQALMAQARTMRPLGRILAESQGVSEASLHEAAHAHTPPTPKLTEADSLGSVLIRWGVITPTQWQQVLLARRSAAETLVALHLCNRDHLMRVQAYQKAKLAALAERRHRLGDVLVGLGSLDRETLAKMLACQVDQPFLFGELLVMQRACTPEAVLEGLAEQERLYTEDAESFLPPLEPMQPPDPVKEIEEQAAKPDRRRRWALALGAAALLGYGAWYGLRYGATNYGWLSMFRQPTDSRPGAKGLMGELRGGSGQDEAPQEPGSRFDPLDMPDNQADVGRPGAQMEGRPATPDQPFAADGAPTPPNANVQMSELAPGNDAQRGAQPEMAFDRNSAERSNVTYPMESGSGLGSDRYAMSRPEGAAPQGDPMRPAEGPQGRTGAPAPEAERMGPQGARYGMRGAEGDRTLNPPAKMPGAPVTRLGARTLNTANDMDEGAVSQSSAIFRFRLGQAYFSQGKLESARQEFLAARQSDPKNPIPLYYLGRLSEQRGAPQAAGDYYRQYLKQAPNGEFSDEATARLRQVGN